MNFQRKFIHYFIGTITSCGGRCIIGKGKYKKETKYIWGTLDVIPLLPLVGVNCHQFILHMSQRMVYLYATDEQINNFQIGYMIHYSLHINSFS